MITEEYKAAKPVEFYHYLNQESERGDVVKQIYTNNGVSIYHIENSSVRANQKGDVFITAIDTEEVNIAKHALERLIKINIVKKSKEVAVAQ